MSKVIVLDVKEAIIFCVIILCLVKSLIVLNDFCECINAELKFKTCVNYSITGEL